jgi:hypothetical protein
MGRYWLAPLLLAGCIDFRQGLACADDRDCVGYQCVGGVCLPRADIADDAGLMGSDAGVNEVQWFATSTGGRYTLTPVASVTTQAGQRVLGFSSSDGRPTLLIQTGASSNLENRVWVLAGGSVTERCSFPGTTTGSGLATLNGDLLTYDGASFVALDRNLCTTKSRLGADIRMVNPGSIAAGASSIVAGPIFSGVNITTVRFDAATGVQRNAFRSGVEFSSEKTNWATGVLVAQMGSSLWSIQTGNGGSEHLLWKTDLDGNPLAVARLPVNTVAVPDLRTPVGLALGESGLLLAALKTGTASGPATIAIFQLDTSRF